jgi:hypothetical protein
MPRRSHSSQVTVDVPGPLSPLAARQEQAARLFTHAHELLAKVAEERRALEQCVAVLQEAPAAACFFYQAEPLLLSPAVGRKAGARTRATLRAQLSAALQQLPARSEHICLTTLFALHRLGVPVALWHFLIPGPLPATVGELAPRGHSPPASDPHTLSLIVSSPE